jgi:hypothetical protein
MLLMTLCEIEGATLFSSRQGVAQSDDVKDGHSVRNYATFSASA